MAVHLVAEIPQHASKLCVIGGDHHIHQHQYMNTMYEGLPRRVYWGLQVLKAGHSYALEHGVPFVVNGDLTHNKNSMDPLVTSVLKGFFDMVSQSNVMTWLIPGNHEKPEKFRSINTLEVFEGGNVRLVREPRRLSLRAVDLMCVPFAYDHKNQAHIAVHTKKPNPTIFIGHFPVDGASLGRHTLSCSVKFNDFMPEHYIALLFNDIHKHQPIGSQGYHLGATMQNNFGEAGYDCGWWLLGSDGREVYLQRLPVSAPQFFYTDDAESAEHFRAQGHYARVRPQTVVKTMMAEQKQARLEFNMQDLDTTIQNYVKFQAENGRIDQQDATEISRMAQVALKGGA